MISKLRNYLLLKFIIIIFISTIFAIYSFEAKETFFPEKYSSLDKKSIIEVSNNLKKTNTNVAFVVDPSIFIINNKLDFLSLAGISKVKTIHCNENGYYSIYQSDRYGFNNPDKDWDFKDIEYLLIGDSSTHGACVNRLYNIASVLKRYSKKNVLNLGQSGNGPLTEFAILREYSFQGGGSRRDVVQNIKKVLWLYSEANDLQNLKFELTNNILNKYLLDQKFTQGLKFKQTQIDQFITNHQKKNSEIFFDNRFIKFVKLYNTRNLLSNYKPKPKPKIPTELTIILKLAQELTYNNNAKLYFIYLPDFYRYRLTDYSKFDNKQEIKKIVSNLGIEFIDVDQEVFKQEKNPLRLFSSSKKNSHYNIEGYKKIALKIYEKTK